MNSISKDIDKINNYFIDNEYSDINVSHLLSYKDIDSLKRYLDPTLDIILIKLDYIYGKYTKSKNTTKFIYEILPYLIDIGKYNIVFRISANHPDFNHFKIYTTNGKYSNREQVYLSKKN